MIIRCLICIPTYNNAGSIAEVVQEVLAVTDLSILILDDGSEIPVSQLVKESDRLKIHRLKKNLGKGAAIQKCFELAIARNFTHIITMDGDGQHKAHDLGVVLEKIVASPWALIIGKRKFSGDHVPKSSQFGRKFSNFWVKYQTDITVEDSQSGFRAYPLYYVQHLSFFTKKYDFEIEVLIRLIWKKVQVQEVTIDVYYPPAHERVSHFDKLWDNVKISLLNTVLVILSLLHSNMSRKRIVASVCLGVFVGIIPIYGFQIYLGALLAFLFRLNFPLMFLAQQISIPPLIPLWTFLSLQIGSFLTGESLLISIDQAVSEAGRLLPVWFLGSAVLGGILATIAGILTIILTHKSQSTRQWTGKDRGGKFGNWFMQTMTGTFGPSVGYFCLGFICPYFYLFAPKAVIAHNQFFKITRPELGFFRRQWFVLKNFYQLGQVLVDNSYSNTCGPNYFTTHKIGPPITEPLKAQKGLVLAGAHMGAWLYATKAFGEDLTVNVIQFDVGPGQNASHKISDERVKYITKGHEAPIFEINRALSDNEAVIFMPDRLVDHNVELILFSGKLAPIDTAAFKIAMAKKAPVSFSFAFKSGLKEYKLYLTDPIWPEDFAHLNKHETVIEIAKKYTESLETFIKLYPTQWFNFFPFWSSVNAQNLPEYLKESRSHLIPTR